MSESIDNTILAFSQQRPLWQQDLFRRAVTQQTITASDINELVKLLKAEYGLTVSEPTKPEPLTSAHVRYQGDAAPKVLLNALDNPKNVNRLASGQQLPFLANGLTIVYGENGSGKSGYCRILKQLCRSRLSELEKVLGDVYASSPQPQPEAQCLYTVGDENKVHTWKDGVPAPDALSYISLFDAHTAPIYVDKHNEIEFLPDGLDILPRVGAALQKISAALEQEMAPILVVTQQPLPFSTADDPVIAGILSRLDKKQLHNLPSTNEIQDAAKWGQQDDMALATAQDNLRKLAEPDKQAKRFRRIKTAVERAAQSLEAAYQALDDQAVSKYLQKREEANMARAAATVAASTSFKTDPFGKEIGTETWRRLFSHAREFSDQVYPGEPFPVVGADKHCVLCQQPLSAEASDRLGRFHQFLDDSASKEVDRVNSELQALRSALVGIAVPTSKDVEADLGEFGALDSNYQEWVSKVATAGDNLRARKQWIKENPLGVLSDVPAITLFDLAGLRSVIQQLETKALGYEQAIADQSQSLIYETECKVLKSRKVFNGALPDILTRLQDLELVKQMSSCKDACDTTAVSKKATHLREQFVKSEFHSRIVEELDSLGIRYLPVKVSSKSEYGASYLNVSLEQSAGVRTLSILSEGEFRVLALAGFFAEIAGVPGNGGIIVDDPVSSLDHRHIRQVARRLVKEATTRPQVIVFTHSLPFYYELLEAAQEDKVRIQEHWITREGVKQCGLVKPDEAPWQVKKVKDRLAILEQTLNTMKKPEDCSEIEHNLAVRHFYSLLRETWERVIEERLFNGVVGRFEPGVKTLSLKGATVEDVDYEKVYTGMTKASRYSGHDQAVGFQTSQPDISEMRKDLTSLRAFESEIKTRSAQITQRRQGLEDPVKVKSA